MRETSNVKRELKNKQAPTFVGAVYIWFNGCACFV